MPLEVLETLDERAHQEPSGEAESVITERPPAIEPPTLEAKYERVAINSEEGLRTSGTDHLEAKLTSEGRCRISIGTELGARESKAIKGHPTDLTLCPGTEEIEREAEFTPLIGRLFLVHCGIMADRITVHRGQALTRSSDRHARREEHR